MMIALSGSTGNLRRKSKRQEKRWWAKSSKESINIDIARVILQIEISAWANESGRSDDGDDAHSTTYCLYNGTDRQETNSQAN